MPYTRKTKDEFHIFANYGFGDGWEHEHTENTWKDARKSLQEYRENAPGGQYKSKKVRVPI